MDKPIRIALLIPHSDTTLETDLQRNLPDNYVLHTTRMWLDEVSKEAEQRMMDTVLPMSIRMLKEICSYSAAVFGCTSASAVYGRDGLSHLEQKIGDSYGCPSISAFGAVLYTIHKYRPQCIALITPYTEEINKFMINCRHQFGVIVSYSSGLGLTCDTDIAKVSPETLIEFVSGQKKNIQSKAPSLLLSCTNLRAMETYDALEKILGVNVITSNRSICQWLLELE